MLQPQAISQGTTWQSQATGGLRRGLTLLDRPSSSLTTIGWFRRYVTELTAPRSRSTAASPAVKKRPAASAETA